MTVLQSTVYLSEPDLYPYEVSDFSHADALVVAPHPDDESIGCGGSIARHVAAGSRVKVLFLTDGDKGDFASHFGQQYLGLRRSTALKAMARLGVKEYEFLGLEDRGLHRSQDQLDDRLTDIARAFSPRVVYVPSPFEPHPDHRAAFGAVWRLRRKLTVDVLAYEVMVPLYPTALVDITGEMNRKREAIASYHTELYYNDYLSKTEGLNRARTATLPREVLFAEAFTLIRAGGPSDDTLAMMLLRTSFPFGEY